MSVKKLQGSRVIHIGLNKNIIINTPIGPLEIESPTTTNLKFSGEVECNFPNTIGITNKVIEHLKKLIVSRSKIISIRTQNEIFTSPTGYLIINEAFRDRKKNPLIRELSTRGKESHINAISIIQFEPVDSSESIKKYLKTDSIIYERTYQEGYPMYGMMTETVKKMGYEKHILVESLFYITRKGNKITFETNSTNTFDLFIELLNAINVDITNLSTHIAQVAIHGRVNSPELIKLRISKYLEEETKSTMTNVECQELWDDNPELGNLFSHDLFKKIFVKEMIANRPREGNKTYWIDSLVNTYSNVDYENIKTIDVERRASKFKITMNGYILIVGGKSFEEVLRLYCHGVKLFIDNIFYIKQKEICVTTEESEEDIELELGM